VIWECDLICDLPITGFLYIIMLPLLAIKLSLTSSSFLVQMSCYVLAHLPTHVGMRTNSIV